MKAAIVYLTQAHRMTRLTRSLRLVQQHLLDEFSYPVILFHEGDFTASHQRMLVDLCPSVEFRKVDIQPPPHIDVSQKHKWAMMPKFGVGYRNMCRFFSLGLYPQIQDLDFYMRLDDDSYILSPIKKDPFETMVLGDKAYAWRSTRRETGAALDGLMKCLADHDPVFQRIKWDRRIFYNNFHIARPSLWTSSPFKEALAAIDKAGGIYAKRWGDAPIQTLLVRTYVPDAQRHQFTGFKYSHGRHTWPAGR